MSVILDWPEVTEPQVDDAELLKRAKAMLKMRRSRNTHFGVDVACLMGDPAYELLLDLYVAHRTGLVVNVSSASVAGGVPVTTGLRLLDHLIQAGAVYRFDDQQDRRRKLVELTKSMIATIERHLMAWHL